MESQELASELNDVVAGDSRMQATDLELRQLLGEGQHAAETSQTTPLDDLAQLSQEKLVEYNRRGMECLSQGNSKEAMKFLKMAEKLVHASRHVLLEEHAKLYSLTMNNLGCYYKK